MPNRLTSLPVAFGALALLAPGAHAATDVVANPGPGISSVRLSDSDDAGKLVVRVTASSAIGPSHASVLFLDIDLDGDSDRMVRARQGATAPTIDVLSTPQSTDACQQIGGATASPVAGATASFASDLSGYTVKLPAAQVSTRLRWKMATPVSGDELCGGTDGAVQGIATSMADARLFTADGVVVPVVDTVAPGAPTGLQVTAGDGAAALDWADNVEADVDGYLVYRRVQGGGFTLVAAPSASEVFDGGLLNGTTYEYYVRTRDTAGNVSDQSDRVTVTPTARAIDRETPSTIPGDSSPAQNDGGGSTPTTDTTITTTPGPTLATYKAPAAPVRPHVARLTARRVFLDWPVRKGVSRYRVYRRQVGRAWPKRPLATVRRSAFVDKKVKPNTAYLYRIVGVTSKGKLTKPSKSIFVKTKRASGRRR
jgi:hypothetical protein